ncbi:Fc receptor-like protein 5 [Hemibagrus wyckioides]|uniref:Fc receptor-like protein 5 n=1 Tax=Hemibagrus wyckioides TaxID=337641 RepID=UPI00266C6340|nr:Fc receptor-like protein 5 [Hemibagrus wyckioides]
MELWSLCVMILFISLIQDGKAQESPKAVVTIKPDKHVFRGETVILRCEIQGGGDTEWTYSWYINGYKLYREYNTQEFSLSSVRNEYSGNFTCRGWRSSDYQSSEISDAVTLTVLDVAEAVVSVSPSSWLTEGDSVTLSCEVKHSSTGWTFSWYTDVPYRDSQGLIRYNRELLSDSSRGSGGSYTLSPVTLNHTGVYVCRAERGVFHTCYSKLQPLWITGESPPVSLIISPSRTQHFTADSLSLSCEDQSDSTGWTVRRYRYSEELFNCSSVSGSTCNISSLSTSHTGVYWCQSESGGRSNSVNITVHCPLQASSSVLRLISSLVTVSVYLLLTIVVAVKCFRARVQMDEDNTQNAVIEERTQKKSDFVIVK